MKKSDDLYDCVISGEELLKMNFSGNSGYPERLNPCSVQNAGRSSIDWIDRMAVFLRDGNRCVLCGKSSGNTELHLDHIIPVSLGGENVEENYTTLCKKCNSNKRDLLFIWNPEINKFEFIEPLCDLCGKRIDNVDHACVRFREKGDKKWQFHICHFNEYSLGEKDFMKCQNKSKSIWMQERYLRNWLDYSFSKFKNRL